MCSLQKRRLWESEDTTKKILEAFTMPLPTQSPVSLYGSVQFDMHSVISGRTYRIFVYKPATSPPRTGYPVMVVTDGNLCFPLAATMAAAFELGGETALVVGVGYATDDPKKLFSLRTRDLTPPTPLSGIPHMSGQPPINLEDYGGSENFYRFLIEELWPVIASTYPVDAGDRTLYGHSWGGLFTLNVLLNHPETFRNFIASSPSIWWNKCSLFNDIPRFIAKVQAKEVAPRILLMVGSKEQDMPAKLPQSMNNTLKKKFPFIPSPIKNIIARIFIKKMVLDWRMIDNTIDLAAWLRQIKGGSEYSVSLRILENEDHTTALSASIGQALAFMLRP